MGGTLCKVVEELHGENCIGNMAGWEANVGKLSVWQCHSQLLLTSD